MATAYLVLTITRVRVLFVVTNIATYSEPHPTTINGEYTVCVASAQGATYDDACRAVIASVRANAGLHALLTVFRTHPYRTHPGGNWRRILKLLAEFLDLVERVPPSKARVQ